MAHSRKNIIDGLPTSYDYNYVLKTNKKCNFCQHKITLTEIENNSIICTEDFDFLHKECIEKNKYELIYSNPKDFTSMIKLKKITVNLYSTSIAE
jgi:predicted nuclease of predicted toxin-antitoxin system